MELGARAAQKQRDVAAAAALLRDLAAAFSQVHGPLFLVRASADVRTEREAERHGEEEEVQRGGPQRDLRRGQPVPAGCTAGGHPQTDAVEHGRAEG